MFSFVIVMNILAITMVVRAQIDLERFMPTRPVLDPRGNCNKVNSRGSRILFISDKETRCFYWECSGQNVIRRQCPLQTSISEFYDADDYNPCTERFDDITRVFDCTRKGFDPTGEPTCVRRYRANNICLNGGTVRNQGSLCWCECAPDFTGFSCGTLMSGLERSNGPSVIVNPVTSGPPDTVNSVTTGPPAVINPVPVGPSAVNIDAPQRQSPLEQNNEGKEATVSNIMDAPTTPKPTGNTLPVLDDDTGPVLFENTRVAIANSAQAAGLLKSVILPHRKPNDGIGSPDIVPPLPLNDEGGDDDDDVVEAPPTVEFAEMQNDEAEFRSLIAPPSVGTADVAGRFVFGDPCVEQQDFCKQYMDEFGTPFCMNNGECQNNCLGPICVCRAPYIAGMRCDQYRCTANLECMNGGKCSRGPGNLSPVATCECMAGFGGAMCEIRMARCGTPTSPLGKAKRVNLNAVLEDGEGGEGGNCILPKSAVSSTLVSKKHHTFKDYKDSNVELPSKSPHQKDVDSRMNINMDENGGEEGGGRVKKKRETNIFTKCCEIL